ncbi:helix-turn-helix domain-containing protein [Luteipulveratus flavus]|uniref:helix-turn-helix domain-containing protein n=1 Tax=Luteipulveratus flavus TaxID=3031728 RepID=UPI0039084302
MRQRRANVDLIGSRESGLILGTSERTVHRLVKAQELTPVTVAPGGHHGIYLFDRRDIERLARKRNASSQSDQAGAAS